MTEGIYGSIIYGRNRGKIHTFYEIDRKYSGRYGSHMVHLRKPLLEYAGPDLVEIEMSLTLDAAWCGNPLSILAEWHFYQENAMAAPLIVGGKPMGPGLSLFVIDDMSEHHKHWLPPGQLISVEVHASFKEYIPFVESSGGLSPLGIPGFGGLF
jgi:Phage P2 GpU